MDASTTKTTKEDFKSAIAHICFKSVDHGDRIIAHDETTKAKWLFDFRAIMLQPRWLNYYAEVFWERFKDYYPFQVSGMETAGIPLVAAIVMKGVERGTPVNGLYVRKSRKRQGLTKIIEGTPTLDPVIIVDDLINTGGSVYKQAKILKESGCSVVRIHAILTFRDQAAYYYLANEGMVVESLFRLADFGLTYSEIPEKTQLKITLTEQWCHRPPQPSLHLVVQKSAPATDGTHIYYGCDNGTFLCLSENGEIRWQHQIGEFPFGKAILSSPLLVGGLVIYGAYDGVIYALNRSNGAEVWRYDDADWVGSSPAYSPEHDLIYVGLEFGLWKKRGGIVALNRKTGVRVWEQTHPSLTHGSPLYIKEENLVIIGSNNAVVYGYEAKSGTLRFAVPVAGAVKASFAYDQTSRLIFFGTLGGNVYAIEPAAGEICWVCKTGPIYSTPAVHHETVFVGSLDKNVYAINTRLGTIQWKFTTRGRIFASPQTREDIVWIGSNDGCLYALNHSTAEVVGLFQATERIVNRITFANNGDIFMTTHANELYKLAVTKNK